MFILNVFKIFFRNKHQEISKINWTPLIEALIIIGVTVGVVLIGGVFCYGTGYLVVEMGLINFTENSAETPYTTLGLLIWIGIGVGSALLYSTYKFIGWIWLNIKMAIAEAKELNL